jgi:Predicted peptidyl-prolyl cis-trans isomerase (rotamase), cyclophilin family
VKAVSEGEVETFGVPKEKILMIKVTTEDAATAHYFRKVTGLSHKPVGQMKVQFSFPGMSMVTFYGDSARGQDLYPQEPFKKCAKGDIGVTNQSRPHHGLIGIRLTASKEFGPTGEEPYGTNMVGKYADSMAKLDELEDEQTVYITEEKL